MTMSVDDVRCALTLRGKDSPSATVALRVEPLGTKARARRALGRLVGCWGAAILSVVVPLLHFILPPTLLVVGVVWAIQSARSTVRAVTDAAVPCPKCAAAVRLAGEVGWPLSAYCGSCAASFDARPVAA